MKKEVAEKIVKGITDKIECNTADIDDWAERRLEQHCQED